MSATKTIQDLGLKTETVEQLGAGLMQTSFFSKLASFGIEPATQEEAIKLWDAGVKLHELTANRANQKTASAIDRVHAIVSQATSKQAASPRSEAMAFEAEVASMTNAYLATPSVFAATLGLAALNQEAGR